MSASASQAPSRAYRSASSRPNPLPAPVTTTRFVFIPSPYHPCRATCCFCLNQALWRQSSRTARQRGAVNSNITVTNVSNSAWLGLVVALVDLRTHCRYLTLDQRIEGCQQRAEVGLGLNYLQRMHARFDGRQRTGHGCLAQPVTALQPFRQGHPWQRLQYRIHMQ